MPREARARLAVSCKQLRVGEVLVVYKDKTAEMSPSNPFSGRPRELAESIRGKRDEIRKRLLEIQKYGVELIAFRNPAGLVLFAFHYPDSLETIDFLHRAVQPTRRQLVFKQVHGTNIFKAFILLTIPQPLAESTTSL